MIEQFISNLFGGALITPEMLQAAKSQLKRSPVRAELLEAKRKLRHAGEVYNIARGKVCPPGKKLTKNKRCISTKKRSVKRKSSKRKSPKRKSKKAKSPKRKSTKRKSTKRKSPKRKSTKRKSTKRKSPKRKSSKKAKRSVKRKSSKKAKRSTKRKSSKKAKRSVKKGGGHLWDDPTEPARWRAKYGN